MYRKIEKVWNFVFEEHDFFTFIVLVIISFIIICSSFTIKNCWGNLFYPYPEQEYQNLEEEANKMILNHNFKTDYRFTVNNYDSESNDLEFELKYNKAGVKVEVENYGKSNQNYEVTRNAKTQKQVNFGGILGILVLTLLLAIILYISVCIFLGILLMITFVINKIITRKK